MRYSSGFGLVVDLSDVEVNEWLVYRPQAGSPGPLQPPTAVVASSGAPTAKTACKVTGSAAEASGAEPILTVNEPACA